ncbi:ATP-binding protein [Streptomyces sp. NPDC020742]|uniref:ATP-binding protein n=1 Tax=Streptomyces sp. NPDC020742 TaxID=3154897 RepID=UPI00340C168E
MFRAELLALPKEVPVLRRAVREYLGGGPCPDVQLCVSEIVGNVIRHLGEGTPVVVRVRGTGEGRTRVEVTDPAPGALPVRVCAAEGEECGRGLALLAAVSLRRGVRRGPGRKTVCCEVAGAYAPPGTPENAGAQEPTETRRTTGAQEAAGA